MKINPKKMDYIEKGAHYTKTILGLIVSFILICALCVKAFAIGEAEARAFIGKEAEILLTIRYKNSIRYIPLNVWIEDVLVVNGYNYVAVKGESDIPFLVPCENIKRIRRGW